MTDTIAQRYQAGATVREIAAECGRSYTSVRLQLIASGVTMRQRGHHDGPRGRKTCVAYDELDEVMPIHLVRQSLLHDAERAGFGDVVAFLEETT